MCRQKSVEFHFSQEQQGYLVDCLIRRSNNTQGIKFVVESAKHPEYIEQRIARFLEVMGVSCNLATRYLQFNKLRKLCGFHDNFYMSFQYALTSFGILFIKILDSRSSGCHGNAHFCIENIPRKQILSRPQDEIAEMSAEKFEAVKKVLKVKKAPKLLTLSDQFWQFYKEISSQQYHFNRVNVEASLLKEIAHEEVLNFYQVRNARLKVIEHLNRM